MRPDCDHPSAVTKRASRVRSGGWPTRLRCCRCWCLPGQRVVQALGQISACLGRHLWRRSRIRRHSRAGGRDLVKELRDLLGVDRHALYSFDCGHASRLSLEGPDVVSAPFPSLSAATRLRTTRDWAGGSGPRRSAIGFHRFHRLGCVVCSASATSRLAAAGQMSRANPAKAAASLLRVANSVRRRAGDDHLGCPIIWNPRIGRGLG